MTSQVRSIGGPEPKTWDDYERGCLDTFGGGYQTSVLLAAFQHGMGTVFNLLRDEFPPAEELNALRAENERLRDLVETWKLDLAKRAEDCRQGDCYAPKTAEEFEAMIDGTLPTEIERLRAEVERLRALLKRCIEPHDYVDAVRLEGEIRKALDAKEGT